MKLTARTVIVGALTAAAVTALTAAPAQARSTHIYTSSKCGELAFDDVGEYLVLTDSCADGASVVGYYSRSESTGKDKAIYLTGGKGSGKTWNKSWPEGLQVKFKVCQHQPNTTYSCSKYMHRSA